MLNEFLELYPGAKDVRTSFCPYRVCPIGAHSDHQYGLVSGFAIAKGIDIVYVPTDNGVVELQSKNFEGQKQFHISDVPPKQNDWADYLRGATLSLARKYEIKRGVYAMEMPGKRYDIGNLLSYEKVQEEYIGINR